LVLHLDLDEEPINTTPMIDVAFNLLIFFMLSATLVQEEQELEMQLPRVSTAAALTEAPREMVVSVMEDGSVVVEGTTMDAESLLARMKAAVAEYPDQAVAVRGHRKTDYEHVVKVYSLVKQSGVKKVVARVMESR
jgi:biopolymer transport protein ExbD